MTGMYRSVKLFSRYYVLPFLGKRSRSISHLESIKSLLKKKPNGEEICVKGWVKGVQGHKGVTFLHLTDGSGAQHLQVVIPDTLAKDPAITFGCCVEAKGIMTDSRGAGQTVELLTSHVEVIGPCDAFEFPFKQRHRHPPQYARDFLHLRPKTNLFSSLLRIRNNASMAIHQFFQKEGYYFIHTPILSSSDCEGACELFKVEPFSQNENREDGSDNSQLDDGGTGPPPLNQSETKREDTRAQHFFRQPTYMTVSGQLHLEVMTGAMRKAYNFGPTFRAENSSGNFHLSEFYMIEAELAFVDTLEEILNVMERLVKNVYANVMESSFEDVELYSKSVAPAGFRDQVDKMILSDFKRISYTEAIDLLQKSKESFEFKVSWGENLKKEHEMHITKLMGNVPVFVTDYPAAIKPFYARKNEDSRTVAASDLLFPGLGELCGSSLREERFEVLQQVMETHGLVDQMSWYLDLRRFGTCPHGGFGLGFERMLMAFIGARSVRDVIPFPRWPGRCQA